MRTKLAHPFVVINEPAFELMQQADQRMALAESRGDWDTWAKHVKIWLAMQRIAIGVKPSG